MCCPGSACVGVSIGAVLGAEEFCSVGPYYAIIRTFSRVITCGVASPSDANAGARVASLSLVSEMEMMSTSSSSVGSETRLAEPRLQSETYVSQMQSLGT